VTDDIVKKCNCCQMSMTARQIVADPAIMPIGIAFIEAADQVTHYYYFQHETPDCGSSFMVDVEHFRQLIDEMIPEKVLTSGPHCEGHCVNVGDLSDCGQECFFAPFRRFLLKMIIEKSTEVRQIAKII
jgi:hypothetical protein